MAMWTKETEAQWQQLAEEVMTGMKEWRLLHPKATFKEIETALDEKWAKVRARMLADVALASRAADLRAESGEKAVGCPQCGYPLEHQGQEKRVLTTHYDQTIELNRSYALCPVCGMRVFPPR
jgi:hypothetical protein